MIAELQFEGPPDPLNGFLLTMAVFSRDGKTTAVLREEAGIATLFDTGTGRRRGVIKLHDGSMTTASFSPDGRTFAAVNVNYSGSEASGGVDLFDVATGKRRARLSVPNIAFTPLSITFIRGGAAFVTTSVDQAASGAGSLQIWDTATLRPIGEPLPVTAGPTWLSSSPDGTRVVHGTAGDAAVLWEVDVAGWQRMACDIAGRTLTRVEWDQYLPGRPYAPLCA